MMLKKVALQSESCHSNHWSLASHVDGSWCHVRRGSSMLMDISKQFERFYCSKKCQSCVSCKATLPWIPPDYYGLTSWCMQFWWWSSLLSLTYYKHILKTQQGRTGQHCTCCILFATCSHPSNDWGTQPCGQTLLGSIYHLQQWQKTSLLNSISILGGFWERDALPAPSSVREQPVQACICPPNKKMEGL